MAYEPKEWECGMTITANDMNRIEQGVSEIDMEYEPTVWECGDIISAERMNKIENGIANAGGGGCDISTAEVTLVNNSSRGALFAIPHIYEEDGVQYVSGRYSVAISGSATVDVLIVSGFETECECLEDSMGIAVTASGDIQQLAPGFFLIAGDGTITVSNS